MKKFALFSILTATVALVGTPAHATHAWQDCRLNVDVAAIAQAHGGGQRFATIHFSFDGSAPSYEPSVTDVVVELPGDGSAAVYSRSVISDPIERRLSSVTIEYRAGSTDSAPSYSVELTPAADGATDQEKKSAPLVCEWRAS